MLPPSRYATMAPNDQLSHALLGREEAGVREALARGANPNTTINAQGLDITGKPFSLRPAEYVIREQLPLSFLDALIEKGANLGPNANPRDLAPLLSFAIRSGNHGAIMRLLAHGAPIGAREWREALATPRPETMVSFLTKDVPPPEELKQLVRDGLQRSMKNLAIFSRAGMQWGEMLMDQKYLKTLSMLINKSSETYLEVLNLALAQDPDALTKACKKAKQTPLHAIPSGADFATLLKHPALHRMLEEPDAKGRTPLAKHLGGRSWGPSVAALLDGGAQMPAHLDGESQDAYWARVAPNIKVGNVSSTLMFADFVEKGWRQVQARILDAQIGGHGKGPKRRM